MKQLTIEQPTLNEATEGLHLAPIKAVAHANSEWNLTCRIHEQGEEFDCDMRFPDPIEPDSKLLRVIAAAENRDMTPDQLKAFDVDTLIGKSVVLGIYHRSGAGGKVTAAVAFVVGVGTVTRFAASLTPPPEPIQPPVTK